MAQVLALVSLLRKLIFKELSSFSSVGFNNFLFCMLFLMSGSATKPKDAFWSTLFFQLVLLAPLLVMFSVETQHRFPKQRTGTWPLSNTKKLLFSSISLAANPLFICLFLGYLFWMGFAVAIFFVLISLVVHVTIYVAMPLLRRSRMPSTLCIPRAPGKLGGVVQETWRELTGTLDFWTAFLIAISGMLYRLLGTSPAPEAFSILALFVSIAMSTIGQRLMHLDEGRALLRYRLLPIAGWKLFIAQDMTFLFVLAMMVSFLSLRTGIAFGLVAIAVGRYPSLRQQTSQRMWRFVGGDPRFGAAQVVLGGLAGIGAARTGLWVLVVAFAVYVASLFWGELLWRRSVIV